MQNVYMDIYETTGGKKDKISSNITHSFSFFILTTY